jgi:hypothetical protein
MPPDAPYSPPLSLEQVIALFDGQRVIGPARDIQEVRNAITAYDALRSEIGSEKGSELASEIGATPGTAIDALILRDLATEPTLSARLLRHGLPRAGYWQVL